ncbi:MAG: eryA, partial [Firmicutes bacterium]|nr:eryA [Bacillota bacterium]
MQNSRVTAEMIQAFLVANVALKLSVDPAEIDPRQPFDGYGLDSVQAVEVAGDLGEWLGRDVSPTVVWDHPTILAVAQYLTADPGAARGAAVHSTGSPAADPGREPIAIIGLGCRFPGARNPEAFWQLLRQGRDAIREVPPDRWSVDAFYDADPSSPGKMNTRWGGFIEQVDQFDAGFFGIAPREATKMDPQQRLLLEVTWEALEDSGLVPDQLMGAPVGVFMGISHSDYAHLQMNDPARWDAYMGTGSALSIAANRISYTFGFQGPSLAIDTACSSSLVSVYYACQSIWNAEASVAVAGGANLILSHAVTGNFTKTGFMAPDGRCKTFDARANGYVRGEGVGVVVLKPMSRAVADGDPIYAVIRGGAINSDGRSNGLTAPNGEAQKALLRTAYARAGVSPGRVQYVEAHGTGTLLGDPIEVKALGDVLAIGRTADDHVAIGSVKSNIGHLEAAAGIAGLIKVALMMKHREIPASIHVQELNPHIPFDQIPVRVQRSLGPWPETADAALAGVSAFGFGGTNAHLVLAEAPPGAGRGAERGAEPGAERGAERMHGGGEPPIAEPHLLVLSAHSPEALRSHARAYQGYLVAQGERPSLHDICYTASVRRGHLDYRLALVGSSREELVAGLQDFLDRRDRPGISSGRKPPDGRQSAAAVPVCEPDSRGAWLAAVGVQYTLGFAVDWQLLYPTGGSHVALPAYPWQRQRYWFAAAPAQAAVPA